MYVLGKGCIEIPHTFVLASILTLGTMKTVYGTITLVQHSGCFLQKSVVCTLSVLRMLCMYVVVRIVSLHDCVTVVECFSSGDTVDLCVLCV
jgi:hypothetical protein